MPNTQTAQNNTMTIPFELDYAESLSFCKMVESLTNFAWFDFDYVMKWSNFICYEDKKEALVVWC